MSHTSLPARLLTMLLLGVIFAVPQLRPAFGAEPGEELLNVSGSFSTPGQSTNIALYTSGPANFKLAVTGGTAGDTVSLLLLSSTGSTLQSWTARSGETIWGNAELPAGGRLRLTGSAAGLNYALNGYARGTVLTPYSGAQSWSGSAIGAGDAGTISTVALVVANDGLYRLSLGATQGAYQLVVDETYLRKTVVSNQTPSSDDSVYYLSAGVHKFEIVHDPTVDAKTDWSVQITAAGTLDSLPSSELTPALGGSLGGGAFTSEAIPLHVAAAQTVNIRIQISGASTDSLQVVLSNGATSVYTATTVAGGEVVWGHSTLTAGANALRITTKAGNTAPLAYTITISAVPQPELNWSGVSQGGSPLNSTIKLNIPTGGLYNFTLGAESGRFQLRINNAALRKIVSDAGVEFSAFLPAGTHTLVVDQDRAFAATSWSVVITPTEASADSLPFSLSGVTLGGTGKDFGEEWLPIHMPMTATVNLKITARGATADDSLRVEIVAPGASTAAYSATTIFKDEVFWATTDLGVGTSMIKVTAGNGNATPMEYELQITPMATTPSNWSGTALAAGLNSTVTVAVPSDGVYTLAMTTTTGTALVLVDSGSNAQAGLMSAPAATGTNLNVRLPLKAGPHTFTVQQDPAHPRTDWQINLSQIRDATPLNIERVTPGFLASGAGGQLTVLGNGFESATVIELVDSKNTAIAVSGAAVSVTELTLNVPNDLPQGVYMLRLSNPGGERAELSNAVSVGVVRLYLPYVVR